MLLFESWMSNSELELDLFWIPDLNQICPGFRIETIWCKLKLIITVDYSELKMTRIWDLLSFLCRGQLSKTPRRLPKTPQPAFKVLQPTSKSSNGSASKTLLYWTLAQISIVQKLLFTRICKYLFSFLKQEKWEKKCSDSRTCPSVEGTIQQAKKK